MEHGAPISRFPPPPSNSPAGSPLVLPARMGRSSVRIEESKQFYSTDSLSDSSEDDDFDYMYAYEQSKEPSCFKCTGLGKMTVLCEYNIERGGNYERVRWVVGPYWNMLAVTYSALVLITGLVYGVVVTSSGEPILFCVGILLSLTMFAFLSLTAFTDPGIFPRHTRPLAEDWTYSGQAASFRPPKVIFCKETELLIRGYDHFCPWSGTVIGEGNLSYFNLFVGVLFIAMVFDAGALVLSLVHSQDNLLGKGGGDWG